MTDAPAGGHRSFRLPLPLKPKSSSAAGHSRNHAVFAHMREQLSDIVRSLWPQARRGMRSECFETVSRRA
jgi:hypothetical protein